MAIIIGIYLVFNILLRDRLIDWIFNTSSEESVVDAVSYEHAELLRNIFSYALLISMILISIMSLVLLANRKMHTINKYVLVGVPFFVAICVFLAMIPGGFI